MLLFMLIYLFMNLYNYIMPHAFYWMKIILPSSHMWIFTMWSALCQCLSSIHIWQNPFLNEKVLSFFPTILLCQNNLYTDGSCCSGPTSANILVLVCFYISGLTASCWTLFVCFWEVWQWIKLYIQLKATKA